MKKTDGYPAVNRILSDPVYREYIEKNKKAEKDRIFCHHDIGHFLDVARIAVILNLKEGYGIDEQLIYAAALLHDIGRWKQYETGEDHAAVSALLAGPILSSCGFFDEDSDLIISAISTHRDKNVKDDKTLNGLLYRADKLSRACFSCDAKKLCDWKKDKKNLTLKI